MLTTPQLRKLIQDAIVHGMRVEESESRCLISTGSTNRSLGLVLCEDGTAYRADLDPTMTTVIRSQSMMRVILGL